MSKTATASRKSLTAAPPEPDFPIGAGAAAAIFFALSLLFFLPAFLPGRHIFGTDYFGGGFFFYHFISERLAAGELPKWVPYVFGGLPLSANPGSTYQPVHFLADLILPSTKIFPAVFTVHFALAGIGMFLLAREIGTRGWVAFLAGLAFQFTGLTVSWVYGGQDGRIIVATLAPLFFFFLHRGIRTATLPPFAGAAVTLASALLSFQIQNSYYLLLGGAIWAVFALVHTAAHRRLAALARLVAFGIGAVALGFLLASVNFLPFLNYLDDSPRGQGEGRGYEYSTSYSMPVGEIVGLAVPEQFGISVGDPVTGEALFPRYIGANGFKLHTEYAGALVLILFVLGFYYSRRDRVWWFFAWLALFMLTISFGGGTPLYRLYYELLPGTKQFRAPSLSFFLVVMSLVAMAAITLERLAALRTAASGRGADADAAREALSRLPWLVGAVIALAMLGMMASAGDTAAATPGAPTAAQGWGRFSVFAALVAGALWAWTRGPLRTAVLVGTLAVVTVADLWLIGKRFFHSVEAPEVTFAADDVVNYLAGLPGPFRVWAFPYPSYWRGAGTYGGDYPMFYGIQQVGGEHPNMLQSYVEYVGAGTETYIDWHNLLAEAGVVDTPDGRAIAFRSEEGFLDAANIRYIVSLAPLANPELTLVHPGPSALVYENTRALPRAYLVPEVRAVPEERMIEAMRTGEWDPRQLAFVPPTAGVRLPEGPLQGNALVTEYEPDRVTVRTEASRPALLVLADNFYEGWTAEVDGRAAEVLRTNRTFRGVVVPAGAHTVVFRFDPEELYTGLTITVAGWALLAGYGLYLLTRRRSRQRAPEAAA